MDLEPGMRVLDLGCGNALSSIFMAREFGVEVWAADLWVAPEDNADRLSDGWRDWLQWNDACDHFSGTPGQEAEMLRVDAGRALGFTRVIGRRVS